MSSELPDCLKLIDRVRQQGNLVDVEWLFGADPNTGIAHDTDPACSDTKIPELPRRIGRFEIVSQLGQGGSGVVLLAIDPDLNRRVALKIPNPDVLIQEDRQRRFLREGEAAAALNHPHIVTVHEAGQVGTVNYIASEYVQGGTLAEWLKANPRTISPRQAAELISVLADAVQHAHSRGVLHRDIKPGNVLLEGGDKDSLSPADLARAVRLSDFGLARMDSPSTGVSTKNSILGTPAYMSPEQAEGRNGDVDATSDVWALGVILYELLVGDTPYQRETFMATLKAIWSEVLVPPSRRVPGLPADLEAICLKCLDKNPSVRYPTAAALADDLKRHLSGNTVEARSPTTLERFGRWCRRNPIVGVLVSLVTVLILLIAAGSSVAALRLSESREEVLDHLNREIKATAKATQSEERALRLLFEARISQVQAVRKSGILGQRVVGLKTIAEAARLIERLKLGDTNRLLLRNEAIACLSLFDLTEDKQWPVEWNPDMSYAADPAVERYAYHPPGTGEILIKRLSDNKLLATLHHGPEIEIRAILFSSDGRYLLASASDQGGREPRLQIWNLETQKCVHTSLIPYSPFRPFDFSRDGKLLAVGQRDGSVELLTLPDFSPIKSIPVPADEVPTKKSQLTDEMPYLVRIHPKGSQIFVCRANSCRIFDLKTDRWERTISFPGGVADAAWNDDGSLLAIAHGESVTIRRTAPEYRGDRGRTINLPTRALKVQFHPNSPVFATYSEDNMTRCWSINDGKLLLEVSGESSGFSQDGKWLSRPAGRWRVELPKAYRSLRLPRSRRTISGEVLLSVHQEGRLLAVSNIERTFICDLATGRALAEMPLRGGTGRFPAKGHCFVTATSEGVYRRSLTRSESPTEIQFRLGSPEFLSAGIGGDPAVADRGEVVACVDAYRTRGIRLHNSLTGYSGVLKPARDGVRWLDLSPNGKYLATGAWLGNDVRLWDAGTGKLLTTLSAKSSKVAFSRDSTMLGIDDGRRFRVISVEDEEAVITEQTRSPRMAAPGSMAFSPDGRLVAMLESYNAVRLLRADDGFAEVARLGLPLGNLIESMTFSPRGDRLIAGTRGSWGTLHVWDLRSLRKRLAEMQLDWDHPQLTDPPDDSKVVKITLDEHKKGP